MTNQPAAQNDLAALKAQFKSEYFNDLVAQYRAEGLGYEPDEETEFEGWLEVQQEIASSNQEQAA